MGRYTTVQTYTDNEQRSTAPRISYESATGSKPDDSSGGKQGFKFQKVENVSGSSAGAGSGEFHTYRALRRKEMFRVEKMEQDYKRKHDHDEFQETLEKNRLEMEEKTKKRADKRKKRKQRQKLGKMIKTSAGEDRNEEHRDKSEDENESDGELETPGGASLIPNDGSFLELMKARLSAQERAKAEDKAYTDSS